MKIVLMLLVMLLPAEAQTSGFVLAQGPGKLVDALIAAGHGDDNLYQALVDITADTNPSVAVVLTPAFLQTLKACPANSAIVANKLSSYAGSGVLINTNCTAMATGLQGGGLNGLAGTTTLSTAISGVSARAAVVSSTSANPIYTLGQTGTGVCGQPAQPSCSNVTLHHPARP